LLDRDSRSVSSVVGSIVSGESMFQGKRKRSLMFSNC
jgi:hypothetical protein